MSDELEVPASGSADASCPGRRAYPARHFLGFVEAPLNNYSPQTSLGPSQRSRSRVQAIRGSTVRVYAVTCSPVALSLVVSAEVCPSSSGQMSRCFVEGARGPFARTHRDCAEEKIPAGCCTGISLGGRAQTRGGGKVLQAVRCFQKRWWSTPGWLYRELRWSL